MAAIDVVSAAQSVQDQIQAVIAVGGVLLTLWVAAWAIGVLPDMVAPADSAASFGVQLPVASAAPAVPASAPLQSVSQDEYERLGAVWQRWQSQIDSAAAQGGVAPAAKQNIRFYDALVARGMDPADAIAAVEARNASVDRAIAREEAADQRRSDALADAHDAAEHAAAIARYQSQPVDLTVRLGGGWK